MKILITGGTGFVGSKVIRALKNSGHNVVLVTRDPSSLASGIPAGKVAGWNPSQGTIDSDAWNGVDAVVHLAGEGIAEGRWTAARKQRILDSRVLGTRTLVQAINALAEPPKIFVSASAVGYYGDRGNDDVTEASIKGTGFLADVCEAWEDALLPLRSEVRTTRLRIGVVLGSDGGMLKRLLPLFNLGVGGRVGTGKQWMSWIHVDDLVALILFALDTPGARGVLNATSPLPVTNGEFTKALGKALHRPTLIPAPAFAIRLAMGELSTLVLASTRALPEATLSAGFSFMYASLETALRQITEKSRQQHSS